jgi:hypothetical protein
MKKLNKNKTKELIQYIAFRYRNNPNYGSTLLNKALYFIDAENYADTGHTITGLDYIKQNWGHTPDPQSFLTIRDELYITGNIEKVETPYFGKIQIKYISQVKPKMKDFDEDEISLIDNILDAFCEANATNASHYSHTLLSWKFAKDREELPFFTYLLTRKEPDASDLKWAENIYNKRVKKRA